MCPFSNMVTSNPVMTDDYPSSNGSEPKSWLERIGHALSGNEPRNRPELLQILKEARDREILDNDSLSMIEGALDVSEMQVRDAMIPRGQMVVLPHDESLENLMNLIVESGHSRFPIVKDDKDEVIGILLAKDLLRFFVNGDEFSMEMIMRPAVFIPESKRLNVLLKDFRSSRNHIAIVVDEYGGVAGLITIEDVLEEIVGDIDDEHDEEEAAFITRVDEGRFTIQALTPIEEFNHYFGVTFSHEEFDTIGGLLTGELGRLPEKGEHISLDSFDFEVLRTDNRRLHLLGLNGPEAEDSEH